MFGSKAEAELSYAGLVAETAEIRALDREAHHWLGPHYRWYHEVRNAKRGEFHLFGGENLEEQLLATRSALGSLTAALNAGLVTAFNSVVDTAGKGTPAPTDWPAKIEMPDRNTPPATGAAEDTLVVSYAPLKFLGLAKAIHDKGKGLPFYGDGLIKKLWFKVIGFYSEPAHWQGGRLGYLVASVPGDAQLGDVQSRLAPLKSDVDQLLGTVQMFRFGGAKLGATAEKNTTEELYKFSDSELATELYLQSLVLHGLEEFLFRYYVTLLGAASGGRVIRQLTHIFTPLQSRIEEVRLQFQTSFATERDKVRLRAAFQAFYKEQEARAEAETEAAGAEGEQAARSSHRRVDRIALARTARLTEGQAHTWAEVLKAYVLDRAQEERGCAFFVEVLNALVNSTRLAVEGKLKVAKQLREFAHNQEKLGLAQIRARKRKVDDQKRIILRRASRYKAEKQPQAAAAYEAQAAKFEQEAAVVFANMQQAVDKRRDSLLARVEQMEAQAKEEGEHNTGRSAATLYELLARMDGEHSIRARLLPYLAQVIQEEKDDTYHTLYRFLFGVLTDLTPTEKMTFRKLVASRMKLEEHELHVSEEELKNYEQVVLTHKTELMTETPGLMDYKLVQGPVQLKLEQLLKLGLTNQSLLLLLQLPLHPPNKPPAKVPTPVVRKMLQLNQLMHPLPEHDLMLPNLEPDTPLVKRINFNRLAKLVA